MVAQFSQNDDPNTGNFVYLVSESGSRVSCLYTKMAVPRTRSCVIHQSKYGSTV